MMKRLMPLLLLPMLAWGQVTPVIPNNTVLVNSSGATAAPEAAYTGDVYATSYGVKANASSFVRTYSISSGSASLTVTGASFTSADVGKVISVPGAGVTPTISGVAISDTTGDFTCTCTGLAVGQTMAITGTNSGSGSITGYSSNVPVYYYVSSTDGVSVFTLQSALPLGAALVTTAGSTTGLTFSVGPQPLITTISGYTSATQVTLAANASSAVSAGTYVLTYGTDDSAAMASAATACNTGGSRLWLPTGNILLMANTITVKGCALLGAGPVGPFINTLVGTTFLMISPTVEPFIATNDHLFRGLNFLYPNNIYAPANVPIIYPALISDNGLGDNQEFSHGIIEDNIFFNPTTVMQTTTGGGSGDEKVLNNLIWSTGAAFKLVNTGDAWAFSNNRFTDGAAVEFCNYTTTCKQTLTAGARMNAIFEVMSGAQVSIAWTGGGAFLWRDAILVDSGGLFGLSTITGVTFDGTQTIVDSSSGGTYAQQNLISGMIVSNCGAWNLATNAFFSNDGSVTSCFNLGSSSGLLLTGSRFAGSRGNFITAASSNWLEVRDVIMGNVGLAADGGTYYAFDFLGTGNHFALLGGSFTGLSSNAKVNAINIGTNAMSYTLIDGTNFTYFDNILQGSSNTLVQVTNSSSFGTYSGGTTLTVTGSGSRTYVGNTWDVAPSSPNAVGAGFNSNGATIDGSGNAVFNSVTSSSGLYANTSYKVPYTLGQTGIPFILPPSGYIDATGNVVLGQNPPGTVYLSSSTAGTGITITCNTACFTGTAAGDTGRQFTFSDGTCCATAKTFSVTGNSGSSTTIAQGTLNTTLTTACTSGSPCAAAGIYETGPAYTATNAAANGTTYSAPLDTSYTEAFWYFPASSAIGSAGWYPCAMASPNLSLAVCYNNKYSSGQPTYPGSPTAFSGLTAAAYTQTTNSGILATSFSLPGNSLGTNGSLDIYDFLVSNNSAGTKQWAALYNASLIGNGAVTTGYIASQTAHLQNIAATGSQTGQVTQNGATNGSFITRLAVDSTATQSIYSRLESVTAATDWLSQQYLIIRVNPY